MTVTVSFTDGTKVHAGADDVLVDDQIMKVRKTFEDPHKSNTVYRTYNFSHVLWYEIENA